MNLRLIYLKLIVLFTSNFVTYAMQPQGLQVLLRDEPKTIFSLDEDDQRKVADYKRHSKMWADAEFNTQNLFYTASEKRKFGIMGFCLDQGLRNFNTVMDYALLDATWNDDEELTKKLLAAGAQPNVQNYKGNTPLIYAAFKCNAEVVHDLLKAGAAKTINVSSSDHGRNTALHVAINTTAYKYESYRKVAYLLHYGARTNELNIRNESPLSIALTLKKFDCVRALMQAGASKELLLKCQDGEKLTQKLEVFAAQERLRIKREEVIRLLAENQGPFGEPLINEPSIAISIAKYVYPDNAAVPKSNHRTIAEKTNFSTFARGMVHLALTPIRAPLEIIFGPR